MKSPRPIHQNKLTSFALVGGLAVLSLVALAVTYLQVHPHTPSQPTITQASPAPTNPVKLTGTVTQSPTNPLCRTQAQCSAPVIHRTVQAIASDGTLAGSTTTDEHGAYSLMLKPGHYTLLVPQEATRRLIDNEINLSTSNHQLDLTLDTGIR